MSVPNSSFFVANSGSEKEHRGLPDLTASKKRENGVKSGKFGLARKAKQPDSARLFLLDALLHSSSRNVYRFKINVRHYPGITSYRS